MTHPLLAAIMVLTVISATAPAATAGGGIASDDTSSCIMRADAARRSGDFERAVVDFSHAIDLGSANPDVYMALAKCQLKLGRADRALETLEHALLRFPDHPGLRTMHISQLFTAERWSDAALSIEAATKLTPNDARLFRLLGICYERTNDSQRAVAAYERSIAIDPNYYDGLYSIGCFYFNQGAALCDAVNCKLDLINYDAEQSDADAVLRRALGYLERASAINSEDPKLRETLQQLRRHLRAKGG